MNFYALIYNPPPSSLYRNDSLPACSCIKDYENKFQRFAQSQGQISYNIYLPSDFNMPATNWDLLSSPNKSESTILECTSDIMLNQFINFPTDVDVNYLFFYQHH